MPDVTREALHLVSRVATLEESDRWQRLISTLSISLAVTIIVAFSASVFVISSKIDEVNDSIAGLKTDVEGLKTDVMVLQSGQQRIFEILRDAKLMPGDH